jgi:hypothetical protein
MKTLLRSTRLKQMKVLACAWLHVFLRDTDTSRQTCSKTRTLRLRYAPSLHRGYRLVLISCRRLIFSTAESRPSLLFALNASAKLSSVQKSHPNQYSTKTDPRSRNCVCARTPSPPLIFPNPSLPLSKTSSYTTTSSRTSKASTPLPSCAAWT